MQYSRLLLVCGLFLAVACAPLEPTPPISETCLNTYAVEVCAKLSGENLLVANNTEKDIYLSAFPERILPVVLWTPVTDPRIGIKVAAKSFVNFNRDRFHIQERDTVLLSWWHLGEYVRDSLYNPDSVRSIRVFP